MSKQGMPGTEETQKEFEAPELTVIGDAQEVVQGVPKIGYDFHGLSSPPFEFESDEE